LSVEIKMWKSHITFKNKWFAIRIHQILLAIHTPFMLSHPSLCWRPCLALLTLESANCSKLCQSWVSIQSRLKRETTYTTLNRTNKLTNKILVYSEKLVKRDILLSFPMVTRVRHLRKTPKNKSKLYLKDL
jgi:hypothetical protein